MTDAPTTSTPATPPPEYYDQEDSDNCCVLCGKPSYRLLYEVTHFGFPFRFQQCQCGLIKQTPMPNEKFFEWFFNSDIFVSAKESKSDHIWGFYDYFKDEPSRLATSRRRIRALRDVFVPGKKLDVLKIGPSTGTFLYVANEEGHNAIGCDVSSRFLDWAKEKYGVRIDHGRFEELPYEDGQFDVILLMNVLENIHNLTEFFPHVYKKLKPGGCMILNQVDYGKNIIARLQKEKYFLLRPPVTYIYSNPILDRVLEKFGFKVEKRLRDIRYMTPEKILTLLGWRWAYRIARFLRLHRIRIPIYAYPSSIVVARKPE